MSHTDQAAITFLSGLVQIPSLNILFDSPESTANYSATFRALEYLETFAEKHAAEPDYWYLHFENIHPEFPKKVPNAVFQWRKGNPTQRFGYIGHVDVVNTGNPADWIEGNPFSGKVIDGVMYGRGTTDMKGSVAAFFMAVARFVANPANTDYDIVAMISGDEEVMALNGARPTLQWMKKNDLWPDVWLVGEPSSIDTFGDFMAEGRRGLVAGTVRVNGVGGHSANPETYQNPIDILDAVKTAIRDIPWRHEAGWPYATRLEFTRQHDSNPFPTPNIVPSWAEVMWSVRYTPCDTAESIAAQIESAIHMALDQLGLPHSAVVYTPRIDLRALPFLSNHGKLWQAVTQASEEVLGVTPQPTRRGGSSDGRFAREIDPDIEILEFGTPQNGGLDKSDPRYGREGGMHQLNECVRISDYLNQISVGEKTLEIFFS